MTLTRFNRWLLVNLWRSHYWCRCGALVPTADRRHHEEFHDAARAFFTPPSGAELDAIRAALRDRREP